MGRWVAGWGTAAHLCRTTVTCPFMTPQAPSLSLIAARSSYIHSSRLRELVVLGKCRCRA